MESSLKRWLQVSLLNLFLVSAAGVILRYKIAFSLPFINQKYLLHGHSHFAVAGWITQTLMVLLVQYLVQFKGIEVFKQYRWPLYGNLFSAYGMLVFFPVQGYAAGSIIFSNLTILFSYWFAVKYLRDLNALSIKKISHLWLKAALLFSVISSFGAFSLAWLMANKMMAQHTYLASVYFFLHFQYNGWFFFACMGLLYTWLEKMIHSAENGKLIFLLFFLSCIPAYFLSALWMHIPTIVYLLVILSALAQVAGWILLIRMILKNRVELNADGQKNGNWLMILSAAACTIKLLLQLGSTHPALSQLAFGFRPIVIGYLHLVLLGVITLFLFGYLLTMNFIHYGKYLLRAIRIFVWGIILNESLLIIQGITALDYVIVPYINEALLFAACCLCAGLILLNIAFRKQIR